ncbi:MAG TPA: PKD domain-containing protein [Thermoanaerobaculia bacterium]|nr:PKD domain-containing protein [Thermoanaerobaculia bacterium]
MDSLWYPRADAPRHHGRTFAARTVALPRSRSLVPALRLAFVTSAFLLAAAAARATDFYAAPGGSSSGSGSITSPWDLQTALNQTVAKPGDTIWLRGGVYRGTYSSYLNGTSTSPIKVRQYPGERATVDGGNSSGYPIFSASGSYTWFMEFEITSSDPNRVSQQTGSYPTDIGRGPVATEQSSRTGQGLKFVNMIIHDVWSMGLWKEAVGSEVYGSIIYYNGWNAPDRGHGHGLYLQNATGTMSIRDNVIFDNFQNGIQCYGSETAYLNNFDIEGNTIFNNGELVSSPANDIIIGGGVVAQNPVVKNNDLYFTAWGNGIEINMGYYPYGIGASNPVMTGNYLGNGEYDLNSADTNTTLTGNSIYASLVNWTSSQFPSNTFYSSSPATARISVRPNAYEAGRANITVYNWGLAATVPVDVTGVLAVGQTYEVRNAQNWFGAPVLTGTYDGNPISLPMTNLGMATPFGWTAPAPSGPLFNVFVIRQTGAPAGGGTAPGPRFSIAPNPANAGQSVQFTDTSVNAPTSWSWNFGDSSSSSNTSTLQNPSHVYAAGGAYTVTLTASNSAGSASTTNTVNVNPAVSAPVAAFSFSPSAPTPSQSVQFTDTSSGSPTAWAWTFGDGGASAVQSPTHVYAAAGTYTVTLKATNAGGNGSTSKSVTVTTPSVALPDPHFSITPNPATAGQTVQLTDTTLNSPTSWSWNFGDPSSASNTSTAKNPSHVYAAAGTYTIRLTATNSAGSSSTTNTVAVNAAVSAPVAAFSFSPSAPTPNQSVQFADASSGSPTAWAWTFGDGGSSTAQSPTHAYAAAGTYTVTLKATNSAGNSSASKSVTVNATVVKPVAAFTAAYAGTALTEQFTDGSTGSPTSWSWNFGDTASGAANISTAKNPKHTFSKPGTFAVTLKATNTAGSGSVSRTLSVYKYRLVVASTTSTLSVVATR